MTSFLHICILLYNVICVIWMLMCDIEVYIQLCWVVIHFHYKSFFSNLHYVQKKSPTIILPITLLHAKLLSTCFHCHTPQ